MSSEIQKKTPGAGYFSSPEKAVPMIAGLQQKQDFKTLASYYDLSDSDVRRVDLTSGDFFIRKKRPETAHPAEFWRYKHPFPPGFKYSGMRPGFRENVYLIRVEMGIDQGANSPNQVGYSYFYMIKSIHGWQILPDRVEADAPSKLPATAPEAMPDL